MNERELRKVLSDLHLAGIRFFSKTGSTNDVALAWAAEGAPDLGLVYAEEQTAGRGRLGRRWFTPPGAALAFSLVIRPLPGEQQTLSLFSGLGALAVSEALAGRGYPAEIKWPNDVLIRDRKVCGILAEAVWIGERIDSLVLGIGINVSPASVPPADELIFPATCLEAELAADAPVARSALLREILRALIDWRVRMAGDEFLRAWQERLAFRGKRVEVSGAGGVSKSGLVQGLERDGSLRLVGDRGEVFTVQFGDVHLRPVV